MSLPEQCNSCGGMCGKGGCRTKSMYPHNWAGQYIDKAKFELLKSVREGCLVGERAIQAQKDADILFNMMIRYKI